MEGGIMGLVIVASAFFIQVFAFGVSMSIGVYNIAFLAYFDNDSVGVSLISSINWAVFLGAGPLCSFLMTKTTFRKIALLGSALSVTGIFLVPFLPYIPAICICFGVLTGLGSCFVYVPSHVLSGLYYDRYQSLATGVATSGSGLGATIMPIIIGKLIDHYGWKGSLTIVAGMELHLFIFSSLLIPPPLSLHSKPRSSHTMELDCLDKEDVDPGGLNVSLGESEEELSTTHETIRPASLATPEETEELLVEKGCKQSEVTTDVGLNSVCPAADLISSHSAQSALGCKQSEVTTDVGLNSVCPAVDLNSSHSAPQSEKSAFITKKGSAEAAAHLRPDSDACTGESSKASGREGKKVRMKKLPNIYLFTDVGFDMYFTSSILWNASSSCVLSFAPEMMTGIEGITALDSAWLMTLFGLGNFFGCLFGGFIGNVWVDYHITQYNLANVVMGTFVFVLPFGSNFGEFAVILLLIGLSFGVVLGLIVVMLVDLIGNENLSDGLGYIMLSNGAGAFAGPAMTGLVYKTFGSYDYAFYLGGVMGLLACAVMWLIPVLRRLFPDREVSKPNLIAEISV